MHSIVLYHALTQLEIKQDKLVPENNSCCQDSWRGARDVRRRRGQVSDCLYPGTQNEKIYRLIQVERCCGTNGQPSGNSGNCRCCYSEENWIQLGAVQSFPTTLWPQGAGFELCTSVVEVVVVIIISIISIVSGYRCVLHV